MEELKNPNFESTKKAVMGSLTEHDKGMNKSVHTKQGLFKSTTKKDYSTSRLTVKINLLTWEFIPFIEHRIVTARQGFVYIWLCFELRFTKPQEKLVMKLSKSPKSVYIPSETKERFEVRTEHQVIKDSEINEKLDLFANGKISEEDFQKGLDDYMDHDKKFADANEKLMEAVMKNKEKSK